MSEFWFADENIVFTAALILMLAIGILQAFGLGDFDSDIDIDTDISINGDLDSASAGDGLLSLLGLGRLPLMILLILFLTVFGLLGLTGQMVMDALTNAFWSPWLAVPITAAISLPLTGILSRPLARIIPRDETTAIHRDELVGRFATIELGKAEQGSPARAAAHDRHGQRHMIMVEPDNSGQILHQGEEVLLVRRDKTIFRAISRGDRALPRL